MGMTLTEKIFARASGKDSVKPGEIVNANLDFAVMQEISTPAVYKGLKELTDALWDVDRVAVVIDHFSPPSATWKAQNVKETIQFVEEYGVKYFYPHKGIMHVVLPEKGHIRPGELVIGSDSHSVTLGAFGAVAVSIGAPELVYAFAKGSLWFKVPETILVRIDGKLNPAILGKDIMLTVLKELGISGATYKALEFTGSAIKEMSIDSRITLTNMSIEAGAKNGIIEPDEKIVNYVKQRSSKPFTVVRPDSDAKYSRVLDIDISQLTPLVACPHSPDNMKPVSEAEGIHVDQAFLGTCTNSRLEDLRIAAKILKGRKIPYNTRFLIFPGSVEIYQNALREGIIDVFLEAGAIVCNSSCGPCGGGHMGVLGDGDVCISSGSRNFKGRMGSPSAQVYLGSSATVAASAVMGQITDPRKLLND